MKRSPKCWFRLCAPQQTKRARSHDMSVTESKFLLFSAKAPTLNINEMVEVNTHYLLSAALEPGRASSCLRRLRSLSHSAKKTRFSRLAHQHTLEWLRKKAANKNIWRFAMRESPPHSTPHLLSSGWVRRIFQLKLISSQKYDDDDRPDCGWMYLRSASVRDSSCSTRSETSGSGSKKMFFWLLLY